MAAPAGLALGLAAGIGGCIDPEPPEVWLGEGLVMVAHEDQMGSLCESTLDRVDGFTQAASDFLGASGSVEYRWMSREDERISPCRRASECGFDGLAFAYIPDHFHEIVHALVEVSGPAADFFSEGLAVSLGGQPGATSEPDLDFDARSSIGRDRTRPTPYEAAGATVSYLINTRGIDSYMDFHRSTTKFQTYDEIADVFQDVYGEDMDAVLSEPREGQRCDYEEQLAVCGLAPLLDAVGDDRWSLTGPVSCEGEGTWGPLGKLYDSVGRVAVPGVDRFMRAVTIEIPEPGTYRVTNGNQNIAVSIVRCGVPREARNEQNLTFAENDEIELESGTHVVMAEGFAPPVENVAFELLRVPDTRRDTTK